MHIGVGDDHGEIRIFKRHHRWLARLAIDHHQAIFFAEGGRKLIHDTARHVCEIVFGFLTKQRLLFFR